MTVRILRSAVWLFSIGAATAFLFLALRRLFYPLELDPIEGVLMEHALRIASLKPLYVEPSWRFVTLPVMPGFPALASLPAQLLDGYLWQPRLISIAATLGTVAIMARIVRAETESWTLGIASAGLALAGYGAVGGQFDVGRPDAVAMLLVFAGFAALRFRPGIPGAILAALALSAAVMVQQQAAWFAGAALARLALDDRRRMAALAIGLVVLVGAGFALLSWRLGPWFNFYVFDVPLRELRPAPGALAAYLRDLLLGRLGPITLTALLSLTLPRRTLHGQDGPWVLMAAAALCSGLAATANPAAGSAGAIPTVLAFALLGPIAIHRVTRHLSAWPGSSVVAGAGVALTAILLQFVVLSYDPRPYLPPARSAQALSSFQGWTRDQLRPLLVLDHGFHVWRKGRDEGMSRLALEHLVRSRAGGLLEKDPALFDRMVEPLRTGPDRPVIVADRPLADTGVLAPLEASYRAERHRMFEVERPDGSPYPGLPAYAYVPEEKNDAVLPARQPPGEASEPAPSDEAAPMAGSP